MVIDVPSSSRFAPQPLGQHIAEVFRMYRPMKPVTVWETISTRLTIADVEAAAAFLVEKWPDEYAETSLHRAARTRALDVLANHVPVDAFRLAFVAAAEEADVLAD